MDKQDRRDKDARMEVDYLGMEPGPHGHPLILLAPRGKVTSAMCEKCGIVGETVGRSDIRSPHAWRCPNCGKTWSKRDLVLHLTPDTTLECCVLRNPHDAKVVFEQTTKFKVAQAIAERNAHMASELAAWKREAQL